LQEIIVHVLIIILARDLNRNQNVRVLTLNKEVRRLLLLQTSNMDSTMVTLIPSLCRWETYVQENVNCCHRSTKPMSRHHKLGNILVSESRCARMPCLDHILGWNPCAWQPSVPRSLVSIGRTSADASQAGDTVNPKRCPTRPVREPDADDGVPWCLGVLQAEPQKMKIKTSNFYHTNSNS